LAISFNENGPSATMNPRCRNALIASPQSSGGQKQTSRLLFWPTQGQRIYRPLLFLFTECEVAHKSFLWLAQ
jgi:hypothetical protein